MKLSENEAFYSDDFFNQFSVIGVIFEAGNETREKILE